LLTSLQDALDRRRGELTRSAHPDAPHLARRGEPTPNTLSVDDDHCSIYILPSMRWWEQYVSMHTERLQEWTMITCLANNSLRYSVCQARTTHGSNRFSWWHNSWWNKDAHLHQSLLFLDDGVAFPHNGVRTLPNLGRSPLRTLSRCAIFVTSALVGVNNKIMCEHT